MDRALVGYISLGPIFTEAHCTPVFSWIWLSNRSLNSALQYTLVSVIYKQRVLTNGEESIV